MKLKIHTDGFEGFAQRSIERAKKMDRGERITPSKGLTFESPMQMFEVLTAQRLRVVEMARTKPYSVTALAKKLKRDTEIGAARCGEAREVRRGTDTGGDQSGAWPGEDRRAGRGEV